MVIDRLAPPRHRLGVELRLPLRELGQNVLHGLRFLVRLPSYMPKSRANTARRRKS